MLFALETLEKPNQKIHKYKTDSKLSLAGLLLSLTHFCFETRAVNINAD